MGINLKKMDIDTLKSLVEYNPHTGIMTWKARDCCMFNSNSQPREWSAKVWNSKFAGKPAFAHVSPDGYRRGRIFNSPYLAHRIAWAIHYGEWPDADIDHINMIRSDNRIENLRLATRSHNMMNTKAHSDNYSGSKGVHYEKKTGRYMSRIMKDGVTHRLGRFNCVTAAHLAYVRASIKIHGGFSRTQ